MGAALSVLVIEESEADALAMLRALESGGYDLTWERVGSLASMAEALDRARWDLVIAGNPPPGMGVAGVLELLQSRSLDVPLLNISGLDTEDLVQVVVRVGAEDQTVRDDPSRVVPAAERTLQEAVRRREQTAAWELLRQSEERYRSLVENM